MPNAFATLSDLAIYMPAKVLTRVTSQQQQAALDAANAEAAGYMRARYHLPLLAYGRDLVRAVCNLAAYDLICGLGFNPDSGADNNWRLRAEDALKWLKLVAESKINPDGIQGSPPGTPQDTSPFTGQPVVDEEDSPPSFTAPNAPQPRGW